MRDLRPSFLCTLAALALMAPAAGCIIQADDEPPCWGDDVWYDSLRNPETNVCEPFGGGGGCDDYAERDVGPLPDWASCSTACAGLDEFSCLATPSCRGTYTGFVCPPNADCFAPDEWTFLECAAVAPSGPVQGECWNLGADECSRHDDCAAFYNYYDYDDAPPPPQDGAAAADSPPEPAARFTQCVPEPDPTECGPDGACPIGSHCECIQPPCAPGEACPDICQLVCVPDPSGCYSDQDCGYGYECTADTECLPPPGCDPATGEACPAVCWGVCVPSQDTCANIDCAPGYRCEEVCRTDPTCPDDPNGGVCAPLCEATCVPDNLTCASYDCGPGYHCEEQCYGCDPLPDGSGCDQAPYCEPVCVPNPDPGVCYGEVACDALPPACPAGTLPGISGACWSGFCIPEDDCEPRDPGSCSGQVLCESLPPECPEGTVAGIEDNCWSGYCIPVWACDDQPVPACGELDEAACVTRADCSPIYDGGNCTCTPDGSCTCEDWRFSRCASLTGGGGDDPGVPR